MHRGSGGRAVGTTAVLSSSRTGGRRSQRRGRPLRLCRWVGPSKQAFAAFCRQQLAAHCPPEAAAPRKDWLLEPTFQLIMDHATERRRFFALCTGRTQARCRAFLLLWRCSSSLAGAAAPVAPARFNSVPWLQSRWSLCLARQRRAMQRAAAASAQAARVNFTAWLQSQAAAVGAAASRGEFEQL